MGIVSLPLMLWDIYNLRVIMAMGMAWDTGPPVWPYQTPEIVLSLLNFPASFVGVRIANALGLVAPEHYFVVFPAILVWWWVFGLRLDRRSVTFNSRLRWAAFSALFGLAVLLLWAATSISGDGFRWWFKYADSFHQADAFLMMTRFLTPAAWCLFIAVLALAKARRVAAHHGEFPSEIGRSSLR
ncbi:MAG: hypothetical protein L0Z53_27340 [Acidobacteriales bacterium]|nr:hypothetical protein [Terriglobales bacterium]